ncbi:MAG: outer membrane protein transport protein [Rhodomicrobium sp.]|jgi:long-chain fatty acid transport protein
MMQVRFTGSIGARAPSLSAGALSLCIALGAVNSASATDGYYLHGYGIEAEGIGGAAVAYPLDSLAIASNPAAALFLGGRFDAGAEWFRPDRSATITGNTLPGGHTLDGNYDGNARSDYLIPSLGWVRQVGPDLAIGIAAYGNGLGSSYKVNPYQNLSPAYLGTAGFDFEQFFLSPTVAYQIAPEHSIGVSVNLAYQRFSANGLGAFAGASADPASLTNKGVDEAFGIGARIGYLGHITPRLSLGAAYTTETFFQDFNGYRGLLADAGAFDAPQNFTVGAAYKLTPRLDVTAEYQFIDYSSIHAVGNAGLANILTGQQLGSPNGPGFNWQDANVFRIGANYQLTPQLQVRGGYAYSTEVIRNDETFLNILAPATVQSQFTAGFTWESPSKRWEYSGYLLYAPEVQVNGQNSIPASFGGGEANIKLSEFSVGFSVGYKFDQRESFKD